MLMKRMRLRELGVRIGELETGRWNAITDVTGVKVGHKTLVKGEGKLVPGKGPVRTGVTAVFPHPDNIFENKVPAAVHIVNGFGKSMGLPQIEELGTIETPILLTNTLNIGIAADALIEYMLLGNPDIGIKTGTVNPIIGECNDGYLNDIRGRHVRTEDVFQALETADSGEVEEGAVGAGTGMSAFEYKGGIGTSSREFAVSKEKFTVGALVLSNFGTQKELRIDGIPVGNELSCRQEQRQGDGSIMVVIATDAPLNDRQLLRIAKRAGIGIARTGSIASHGSGDFIIAFSTVNQEKTSSNEPIRETKTLKEDGAVLEIFFQAAVDATEEAIINSVMKAESVEGRDGNVREGIPLEEVKEILKKHGRDG